MISSATIILSYFSLILTNGEKICWSKHDQWQPVFRPALVTEQKLRDSSLSVLFHSFYFLSIL